MRAPRIVEKTRYLPIMLLDNPEDLEVARMVTLRAIARDAVDLGKDALAEAFERERMHAPQHFPIRFLNLLHSVPVDWGSASVTREAAACVGPAMSASQVSIEFCYWGVPPARRGLRQYPAHVYFGCGRSEDTSWEPSSRRRRTSSSSLATYCL